MPAQAIRNTQNKHPERSPAAIVGVILAMGVIRLIERQKSLDSLTEQRVSTGVPTTKEKQRE